MVFKNWGVGIYPIMPFLGSLPKKKLYIWQVILVENATLIIELKYYFLYERLVYSNQK
jgi:hypothetical protein